MGVVIPRPGADSVAPGKKRFFRNIFSYSIQLKVRLLYLAKFTEFAQRVFVHRANQSSPFLHNEFAR